MLRSIRKRRQRRGAVTAALAALTLPLAACAGNGGGATSGGNTLTVYSSGDVNIQNFYNKVLIPEFKKENPKAGVKFVFSVHSVEDTAMISRLSASEQTHNNPPMDVVEGPTQAAALAGLLTTVSASDVPAISTVAPAQLQKVHNTAVPWRASAVVLAYNSQQVPTPPSTLADLLTWIKAHPGRFTYCTPAGGGSGQGFVETVMQANQDPAQVQTLTTKYDKSLESGWSKGWSVLKGLTPSVYQHQYPTGNQDVLNLLGKGTIWMAPVWSDQSLAAKQQGLLPSYIKVTQISDPPFTGSSSFLGVPTNSKHKALAYKFIQAALSSTVQAQVVSRLAGYPAVPMNTLPAGVQGAFGNLDTQKMSNDYHLNVENDMKQDWQNNVP